MDKTSRENSLEKEITIYLVSLLDRETMNTVYVGQTKRTIEERWRQHVYASKNPKFPFNFAINKYGATEFFIESLGIYKQQVTANKMEKYYADLYETWIHQNGYNCKAGEERGSVSIKTREKLSKVGKGRTFSEEHKRRISESQKGKIIPHEVRLKIAEAAKGRECSEETRNKHSENVKGEKHPLYGKHHSEETKKKMSESKKGMYVGEKSSSYGKPRSDEVKQKISHGVRKSLEGKPHPNLGRKLSEETKFKLSQINTGKIHSDDSKRKMSLANSGKDNGFYGKHHSKEVKNHLSEIHTGMVQSEETVRKRVAKIKETVSKRSHKFVSPSGEKVVIGNVSLFSRENNLNSGSMYAVLNGKRQQHKGWRKDEPTT